MIEEFFVEIVAIFLIGGAFCLDRRIRASSQKEKARAILSSPKGEINRNLGIYLHKFKKILNLL